MNLRLTPCLLLSIALFAITPLPAQEDAGLILKVGRVRSCVQTNRDAVWPDAQSPYCFFALVRPDGVTATVTSATIKPPGAAPILIPPLPGFPGIFGLLDCGTLEQEIDVDYPPGAYEFVVEYFYLGLLPDTFRSSIGLESNRYPSTPLFLDIDPNRLVSSASDLPLSWTPFVGGSDEDGMLLQIFHTTNFVTGEGQVVFQMPVPATNPSPHVVIPANTFLPDQRYDALLTLDRTFASRFDVHDVADLELFDLYALTQSTYTKTTRMPFRTTSGPYLTVISSPGATPFRFRFAAIVGQNYQIQVSSNLVNWATTRTTNAATTQVIYEAPQQPAGAQEFFRILSP